MKKIKLSTIQEVNAYLNMKYPVFYDLTDGFGVFEIKDDKLHASLVNEKENRVVTYLVPFEDLEEIIEDQELRIYAIEEIKNK